MQSQDELRRIIQSTQVNLENPADLIEKMETANKAGAVSHTIGKLPKSNEVVEINGLKYKVQFADYVKGRYTIKLTLK